MLNRIKPTESAVIIMDVQDRGAAAAPAAQIEAVTRAAIVMIEAARLHCFFMTR